MFAHHEPNFALFVLQCALSSFREIQAESPSGVNRFNGDGTGTVDPGVWHGELGLWIQGCDVGGCLCGTRDVVWRVGIVDPGVWHGELDLWIQGCGVGCWVFGSRGMVRRVGTVIQRSDVEGLRIQASLLPSPEPSLMCPCPSVSHSCLLPTVQTTILV